MSVDWAGLTDEKRAEGVIHSQYEGNGKIWISACGLEFKQDGSEVRYFGPNELVTCIACRSHYYWPGAIELVAWFRRHLTCQDVEIKSIGSSCFDPRLHCSGCMVAFKLGANP